LIVINVLHAICLLFIALIVTIVLHSMRLLYCVECYERSTCHAFIFHCVDCTREAESENVIEGEWRRWKSNILYRSCNLLIQSIITMEYMLY
jgi:hypothetical protein